MQEEYTREEYMTVQKFIKKAKKIVRDYINLTMNCEVNKQNISMESFSSSFNGYKAEFICAVLETRNKYVVEYNSDTDYFYLDIFSYKTTIEYSGDDIRTGRDFNIEINLD